MTHKFIEELFLRIEGRLNALENEMHEMRIDIAVLHDDVASQGKSYKDLETIKRFVWVGRGIVLAIWGIIVTVINLLIGKWISSN